MKIMNALNFKGCDLTTLVIKYDLERAVNMQTENDFKFLTLPERIIIEQYVNDQSDILECIRDFLLDSDSINETILLVRKTKISVLAEYSGNSYLPGIIDNLEQKFITSVVEHNGNDQNLFIEKEKVAKNAEIC